MIGKLAESITRIPFHAKLSFLLTFAVAILFGPAVNYEFLNYDDPYNVYLNPLVTHFAPDQLVRIWKEPYMGLYIPLTYTLLGLLGRLAAWLHPAANPTLLDPAVFHAANITLHAGSVLVVFAILRLLLKRDMPAALGAMLFGLHPVQVASVTWISEIKGLLAGFLGLLAIWQYLRYAGSSPTTTFRHHRYLIALGLFLASLLAKPNVVTVPLMAGTISVLILRRNLRQVTQELAPWLLVTIPIYFIATGAQPAASLEFIPNWGQRFLVAGDAITFYISKLIWPFRLGPDYGRDPQEVLASGWIYLAGLLPYTAAALLLWQVRRPWLVAGIMIFVVALLPVLGFIPFVFQLNSTVANRYLYMAMLAPALLLGRMLCLYPDRRITTLVTILLLILAFRSADRLRYFHDSLTFNLRAVEINPESYLACNNLGVAFKELGRTKEATAAFKQAVINDPDRPAAYANLGVLYAESGSPDEASAYFFKALEHHPLFPERVYLLLGLLYSHDKPIEALNYFRRALEVNPGYSLAYSKMGNTLAQLGRFDEAIANQQRAISLDPYLAEAYTNLGRTLELMGRKDEAAASYRHAIQLQPESWQP